MNADIKAKWLEALRSGKYAQGRKYLRRINDDGDRFCCLGVLCDIIKPSGWGNTAMIYGSSEKIIAYTAGDMSAQGVPPTSFLDEIGLDSGIARDLARMNDRGDDFEVIAKAIERDL